MSMCLGRCGSPLSCKNLQFLKEADILAVTWVAFF